MIQYTLKPGLRIAIFGAAMLLIPAGAFSQAKTAPVKPVDSTPAVEVNEEEDQAPGGFIGQFRPEAGLFYSPSFPMGDLGSVLNPSFGAISLYYEMLLPIPNDIIPLKKMNLYASGGLKAGFQSYSTDPGLPTTGSATLIPVLLYTRVAFPLKLSPMIQLEPYGKLNFGVTLASSEASGANNVNESSVDGSFSIALGSAFLVKPLHSAGVVPYLELEYYHAAEKLSGQFLQISLGFGYRFK